MREAFELGWLNAFLFCKGKSFPEIHNIEDIQFLAPLDIGSTLSVRSKVTYA
jgi:acyl dehydratase